MIWWRTEKGSEVGYTAAQRQAGSRNRNKCILGADGPPSKKAGRCVRSRSEELQLACKRRPMGDQYIMIAFLDSGPFSPMSQSVRTCR